VLPAGRVGSNPLGALTSERMRKLVAEAATVFDWVLLDAPPVGLMPDASLLVSLTQGVVFVIAAGSTPHALIERAIAEVGRENIIGTVLNQVAAENIPSADYYNQYYEPAAAL
jgi:Mrp family chromosome partitioning ATPase